MERFQMSAQAEVCSRCHVLPAMTICEICRELKDMVKLCGDCFAPHYRLQHNYDPNTGEQLNGNKRPKKDPRIPFKFEDKFTVITTEPSYLSNSNKTLILKTPKSKGKLRKAVDKQIEQDWIRANLK